LTNRLILLLLILAANVSSALGVVYARHQSRHLSVQLSELEAAHDAAVAEWSRLQLEQAYLADAGQIESTARSTLRMQQPEQVNILVIGR
jgi:cell division protein FtsL